MKGFLARDLKADRLGSRQKQQAHGKFDECGGCYEPTKKADMKHGLCPECRGEVKSC